MPRDKQRNVGDVNPESDDFMFQQEEVQQADANVQPAPPPPEPEISVLETLDERRQRQREDFNDRIDDKWQENQKRENSFDRFLDAGYDAEAIRKRLRIPDPPPEPLPEEPPQPDEMPQEILNRMEKLAEDDAELKALFKEVIEDAKNDTFVPDGHKMSVEEIEAIIGESETREGSNDGEPIRDEEEYLRGGGGADYLVDLIDTNITSPAQYQVLSFSTETSDIDGAVDSNGDPLEGIWINDYPRWNSIAP